MSDGRYEKSWHGVPCRYPDEHGHPLTAEERAKNCLPGCYDPQGRQCSANETCEIHYRVALEIKAACEEAVKEFAEGHRIYTSHEWAENKEKEFQIRWEGEAAGYEKGFAEARGWAVKIVQEHCEDLHDQVLANRIRALTPAGQEKE